MFGPIRRLVPPAQLCAGIVACLLAGPASAGPLGLPGPQPGQVLRDTTGRVRDTVDRTTDAVDRTTDKLGNTVGTVTDNVGNTVGTVTEQLGDTLEGVTNTVGDTLDQTLSAVGRDLAGRPIVPDALEKDPQGHRIVGGRVLAIAPSDGGLSAARALQFEIVSNERLSSLGLHLVILRAPLGMSAVDAVAALRKADPRGSYDFAHVYDPSGDGGAPGGGASSATVLEHDDLKVGMIDAGIDKSHPAFGDADITTKVTVRNAGAPVATAHGTAVASLLVGEDDVFRGALVGSELYAADAFGGSPTGGAADDIARALAWLADKDVPVINISITGPRNAVLEAAVRAALVRGHVIVAPVGNDGPAAPVKYPAAYDGVVAVTSVDAKRKVQLDANRGPEIAFAAEGVAIRVARPGGTYGAATGTSFASPLVAARFAELLPEADAARAADAGRALIKAAVSPTGARDAVYGYGILEHAPTSAATTAAKR